MFCSTGLKWLSRDVVLRQFLELVEDIEFFMSSGGESVPQLTSRDWVRDFAFLVVVVTHLTMLAISLRRCAKPAKTAQIRELVNIEKCLVFWVKVLLFS